MKTIFFILVSIFSLSVQAQSEVTCWDGSCLKNGWTWLNYQSGSKTDLACYREGCEKSGWIGASESQRYYTSCKDESCFKYGWYRIDQATQNVVHNVVCRTADSVSTETDCFKYGWVIYGTQGQEAVMSCFYQDCRNKGWLIQTSYGLMRATCKSGGCWTDGWIEN